ncbi:hypothetical protein FNL56_18430 [Tardiphaga sp. vice304]|uniref:hypothetical protein n=1 Tax=Tardiphaga sp. vice304 TaxID=2592817 RepID=UPI00116376E9|nr:hypothetical protein [Tardiphaga sp. vice304]QDM27885.1 hypothetical protein FNL56_18430 [Tardiphaga sp. vice304]
MADKEKRPRGRPAVPAADKKRRNFTFRGTDELHEHMSAAAAASGRSMSEEIEWRLGQSFFIDFVVKRATDTAVAKTLAYVDDLRAKEDAERSRPRYSLADLHKLGGEEK